MILTKKEKMAEAISSRLRYMGLKARRSKNKVKVMNISDKKWSDLISHHSKGLFKSVPLERIR